MLNLALTQDQLNELWLTKDEMEEFWSIIDSWNYPFLHLVTSTGERPNKEKFFNESFLCDDLYNPITLFIISDSEFNNFYHLNTNVRINIFVNRTVKVFTREENYSVNELKFFATKVIAACSLAEKLQEAIKR